MDNPNEFKISAELRVVISRLGKVLRKEYSFGKEFSLTEISTLFLIYYNNVILPSELAAIEKVSSQSMSQIVNKFLKMGLINRTSSQNDKRKTYITLTEDGLKVIEKVKSERRQWLNESINSKINDEEKEILAKAIDVMHKLTK